MEEHVVTEKEKWEEEMFLGLRKTKGVSLQHFSRNLEKSTEIYLRRNSTTQRKRTY